MIRIGRAARAAVLAACLPLFLGCGTGKPTGTVTGQVTLDGNVLTSGMVTFTAEDGVPITEPIQSDGKYNISNVPVGMVIITVVPLPLESDTAKTTDKPKLGEPPPPIRKVTASPIPPRYSDLTTSDLKCDVQKGTNTHNITMVK